MNNEHSHDLVGEFIAGLSSQQTRRAYRTDLRQFLGEPVDRGQIRRVSAEDVQGCMESMHDLGRTAGTQRRQLAALRSFFDWLMSEGVSDRNPARHPEVEPLPVNQESAEARLLTQQELSAIVQATPKQHKSGLRDRALILTIVYGALRRSNAAGLEVGDLRPLGRHWIIDLESTVSGGAYVRIPEALVELLERVQRAFDISEGSFWRSRSNRSRGEPLSPSAIYRIVRDAGRRADLGTVSIDTLRRTGLRLAIQGGATLSQVQAHGRYGDSSSVARLAESDAQSGPLTDSVAQHIDFDLKRAVDSA